MDRELGAAGAVKLRVLPGPVGALNPAGPRGGDLAMGARGGERGVDLVESLSRYARPGGDRSLSRSRGGERALKSRLEFCCT